MTLPLGRADRHPPPVRGATPDRWPDREQLTWVVPLCARGVPEAPLDATVVDPAVGSTRRRSRRGGPLLSAHRVGCSVAGHRGSLRLVVSVGWVCSGLKVALQPAVTPPERCGDGGPHDGIDDLPPRVDRQPVGEHRGATRAGGGYSLVTRSPGEPARRRLHEAPFGQHLQLHRSARDRHKTEQQEPRAKRWEHPGSRRGQAILERRTRHLRERPQLVVRAADANNSIPHEGERSLQLRDELDLDWHLPRLLHGKAVSHAHPRDPKQLQGTPHACPRSALAGRGQGAVHTEGPRHGATARIRRVLLDFCSRDAVLVFRVSPNFCSVLPWTWSG